MKNLKKKNNKGFSLVELIVVVMIMAILAVALAPQVMKWVGNSKVSSDVNTYESMVSSLQLALADEVVYSDVKSGTVTVTLSQSADVTLVATGSAQVDDLTTELGNILGTDFKSKIRTKTGTYSIEIKDGVITRSAASAPTTTLD